MEKVSGELYGDSAEHAMTNKDNDSSDAARIRTCAFTTRKIEEFKKDRYSTDPKKRRQAHFALGEALHPVMALHLSIEAGRCGIQ